MLAAGDAVFGADPGRAAPAGHANPYLVDVPEGLALFGVFRGQRPQTLPELRVQLAELKAEFYKLRDEQIELDNKIRPGPTVNDDQAALKVQIRKNNIRMRVLDRKIIDLIRRIHLEEANHDPRIAQRKLDVAESARKHAQNAPARPAHPAPPARRKGGLFAGMLRRR